VGIERGADFVFYCAILMMFVGFFLMYSRMRRMESSLTKLVRQLAIASPVCPVANPPTEENGQ